MKPWRKQFGIWVPDKSLSDERGFINAGAVGAIAGSRRRSVASIASPLDISGCILWLAADGSVYNTGTTQATNGQTVETWVDQSAAAMNATQATTTNKPTFVTGVIGTNAKPVIRFDGANDYLSYATSIFAYTGSATVFGLVKNLTTAANEYGSLIAEANTSGSESRKCICCSFFHYPDNAMEICTDVYAPGGMRYNSTQTASNANRLCWKWENWSTHKTNGNTILSVNGSEVGGTAFGSDPLSGGTSAFKSIGRSSSVGDAGNYAAFDVAEIIVYNTGLSSADRSKVMSWMSTKYGL